MGNAPHDSYEANGEADRRLSPRSPRETLQPEPVPAPPPPSRLARHPVVVVLNGLLTFVVLAILAIGAGLYWGKTRFDAEGPLTESKSVMITRGSNAEAIAGMLERHGVIENKWVFFGGILVNKAQADLKAGEYLFKRRASMREVMETIVEGRSIEYSVTVPEGLTSQQIVARLTEDPVLVGTIESVPPEGSLLPETYKFTRGTSRPQIIDRMRRAHDRAVQEVWEKRAEGLPLKSPDELVTMASIVEKETGKADERPRVAAVFINRLKKNMRLQSDPTIIYGLVGGQGSLGRPILKSEIDRQTAYNTYQISGLPPGPIANPGRAALEAAANPSRTEDLYFVADGTGGHIFAATYDDHQKNVNRWRRIERDRASEAAKAEEKAAAAAAAADAPATDTPPAPLDNPADAEPPADDAKAADSKGGGAPKLDLRVPR
ncbi:MAG: endolytic transglycosylase MltG [Hyphomicrobiales bacterium]